MNILTFDIEDWFHLLDVPSTAALINWKNFPSRIEGNVDRVLEITTQHNYKATFFCLGWIAEQYPNIIRRIDELGFEVASHSYSHQLAYQQSPVQFRHDITRSICTLEDIIGRKVESFRAPGFSIISGMPWFFEILIELGIKYDSSIFPAARKHGGFANFGSAVPTVIECASGKLKEFPINLGRFLGKQIVFLVEDISGYYPITPFKN